MEEQGIVQKSVSVDEQSVRQFENSSELFVEPGKYSSVVSQLEEVTISPAKVKPEVKTFEGLQPLVVNLGDPLRTDPGGALHGVLENGIQYYVRKNAKPRDRAALALAVNVG